MKCKVLCWVENPDFIHARLRSSNHLFRLDQLVPSPIMSGKIVGIQYVKLTDAPATTDSLFGAAKRFFNSDRLGVASFGASASQVGIV